ncbi:lactadherin-like [Amphiura filiformis]|uniref:lactadherin-like n=1 Tax=Amphiura filiformis TaxID=82378 RepID=UPI003B21F0B3
MVCIILAKFGLVMIIFSPIVSGQLCVLEERPDPARGGALRWSLPYKQRCHCQRVVAPRKLTQACSVYGDIWFVDDPTPLTNRMNWNQETLDILLERHEYCNQPLGLADGRIDDRQMTASSSYGNRSPWEGRLHNNNFWASSTIRTDIDHWLQVDFLTSIVISGIQTQGTGYVAIQQWVTRLTVSTGSDETVLTPIEEADGVPKIFAANVDTNSVVDITFPELITARILRVYAMEWYYYPAMRMEVIGRNHLP